MIFGSWAFRLPPIEGELLSSCLARNAYAHGSTPYRFLALFWQRDPVWERDFDRDPARLARLDRRPEAPDWLEDVAGKLGVRRSVVEEATLVGFRECLGGPRLAARGDTPLVLSAGVHHRTRMRHALQFCPDCLAEGTVHFRKVWRLGFVVSCPKHGRGLLDGCSHCGEPVIPHRSMTDRLTDCYLCGRPIAVARRAPDRPDPPNAAVTLQNGLIASLCGDGDPMSGPWPDRVVFDVVRCLLAVSAAPQIHARLRKDLGLGELPAAGAARLRFEQTRLAVRIPWLETVGTWLADWPRSFRNGAHAAGLTRRSFVRRTMPPHLAEEVGRLPTGVQRDRTWIPVLEEPVLRRLRRKDPTAYRQLRAKRILVALGRQP